MIITIYRIDWTTGDSDICNGVRDLDDLVAELGFTLDRNRVLDGDRIVGKVTVAFD